MFMLTILNSKNYEKIRFMKFFDWFGCTANENTDLLLTEKKFFIARYSSIWQK